MKKLLVLIAILISVSSFGQRYAFGKKQECEIISTVRSSCDGWDYGVFTVEVIKNRNNTKVRFGYTTYDIKSHSGGRYSGRGFKITIYSDKAIFQKGKQLITYSGRLKS